MSITLGQHVGIPAASALRLRIPAEARTDSRYQAFLLMRALRPTHLRKEELVKLVAVALATVAVLVAAGAAAAQPAATHRTTVSAQAFRGSMDRLWEEHVAWTRMAIVAFAAGAPNLTATEARLLRNQADIGNAIKPYYGAAAGAKLTGLLRTHILQAVTVLKAAKAGHKPQLNAALKAWYANGHEIAAFLSKANAKSWPLHATTMMMDDHLKLTTQEAVDELGGHWAASVADYDKVESEILMMSKTLADGIVEQFPSRFAT